MFWTRLLVFGLLALLVTHCSKEESPLPESDTIPLNHPQLTSPAETPPISGNAPVVLSDAVKGKWKGVKLLIEDKNNNSSKEYKVTLGETLSIPDSTLAIKVNDFLPDLKVDENRFISASAELLNPAVHVQILEDGEEIFNGWLFQLFPTVHPFRHERFSILLSAPVPVS